MPADRTLEPLIGVSQQSLIVIQAGHWQGASLNGQAIFSRPLRSGFEGLLALVGV
jgi:hypothetical protein